MSDAPCHIRKATPSDVPLILSLIQSLAEYERLGHEVRATEEDLRETLFGDRPYAEVLIAECQNMPAAFALYYHNYSTFLAKPGLYLEDIYVKPAYRGRGIGRALVQYLAKLAMERGCGRVDWWVLDWNESAVNFYKSFNAEPMRGWTVYRLRDEPLAMAAEAAEANPQIQT